MQTTTQQTVTTYSSITEQAKNAATKAQADFLAKWNANTGGNEYGEPMYCGLGNCISRTQGQHQARQR